ncbi:MAG: hypothetical protein KJ065_05985 [Anaerolineae bacterium]|nr:hypothetical protein [Anaerolineae bacterium]
MMTTPTLVEIGRQEEQGTLRQRWSHYFVLLYGLLCLIIAINLRDSTINATTNYSDVTSGIRAAYPMTWVIDSDGPYVFRVRDMARIGFKTSIVVDTQPVSLSTTTRNLVDALSLDRGNTLTGYRILEIDDAYTLPDDTPATAVTYTYVNVEVSPILQTLPSIVEGFDVIAIRQGQAVILSFLADASVFEEQRPVMDRFLESLEF